MKFQTKIFITYSILMTLLISLLTFLGRQYIVNQTMEEAIKTMEITAEKSLQQLEEVIRPMQFISDYLLSDITVLDAMSTMAVIKPDSKQSLEYEETARQKIRHALYTYCILENFHRISYFNDDKDFVTSNFQERSQSIDHVDYEHIPWLNRAKMLRGKSIVGGAYIDPWAESSNAVEVFALGRAMPGIGYLEVQHKKEVLAQVFSLENDTHLNTVVFDTNNTVLYSDIPIKQIPYFLEIASELSHYQTQFTREDEKTNSLIIGRYSESTGIRMLLLHDLTVLSGSLGTFIGFILIGACLILLFSLAFIFLFARKLSKPIRNLKHQIESTSLSTLGKEITVDTSHDEIEEVSNAYAQLLKELNKAIKHQENLAILNLQAQMNSLQAQINPHFLNNVLNVISYRGLLDEDEEICNMCDSLASLLRYSTDTKSHTAKISEELEHFSHYQHLLKVRYQDKIFFETEFDTSLGAIRVPRFLIQPIVENSIRHGFVNHPGTMYIKVCGKREGAKWIISIEDNGQGFSNEQLQVLKKEMQEVTDKLFIRHENIEFTSRGIGIINTYARLLLFAEERQSILFEVANRIEGGAIIRFGGLMHDT
ncbi:MAG: sensor histidine kinase [Sphaerochaetaceae bacterium]